MAKTLHLTEFDDYRAYIKSWLSNLKDAGLSHGAKSRLAKAIGVGPAMISLILKGEKNFSQEQAADVAEFMHLNDFETDYFLLLVDIGRCGSYNLKRKLLRRLTEMKMTSKTVSQRVRKDHTLTDIEKAIYYSTWLYTGVRNLSAIEEFSEIDAIADHFRIPKAELLRIVDFLTSAGLVVRQGEKLKYGPAHLHLEGNSPFAIQQHKNWRGKGFQVMDQFTEKNLFYTCPLSLSREDAERIRSMLPDYIESILKIVRPSRSEAAYCFNIDWFEF